MNKDAWVLILCFVILIVAIVTLTVLRFAKSSKTTKYLSPSFNEMFQQMQNTDNISLVDPKPFRITSGNVIGTTKDAFVIDDNSSQVQTAISSNLLGFVFSSSKPITVTSFQILARCVSVTRAIPRNIALYDMESKQMLAMSVVDPANDPVDANGFYTAALGNQTNLNANKQYVLVAQSVPFDVLLLRTEQTGITFSQPVDFLSGAQTNNSSDIAFPSIIPSETPVFASFQFRSTTVAATTVFGVETANGGVPTSPPQYLSGCIASVFGIGSFVLVQPGIAKDTNTNVSIVLSQPTKVLASNSGVNGIDVDGLVADTWYYLYVVSSDQSSRPTACLLSRGRVNPQKMPDGYVYYRRIGSVYARSTTTFHAMQQENIGRRRTTFWTGDVNLRNFVTDAVSIDAFIPTQVMFVPPSATMMSVGVRGIIQTGLPFPTETPVNAIVKFKPMLQDTVVTLGLPNDFATYGQIDVPLNNAYLPQSIEFKFIPMPGTGGSIPNTDSPFQRFVINCNVIKYVEML